jgi:hypothetical protein
MNSYTIDQIERAINIWRARQASGSDAALCRQARVLAEPYALAIFEQRTTINERIFRRSTKRLCRRHIFATNRLTTARPCAALSAPHSSSK